MKIPGVQRARPVGLGECGRYSREGCEYGEVEWDGEAFATLRPSILVKAPGYSGHIAVEYSGHAPYIGIMLSHCRRCADSTTQYPRVPVDPVHPTGPYPAEPIVPIPIPDPWNPLSDHPLTPMSRGAIGRGGV